MASAFRRDGEQLVVGLDPGERELLTRLLLDVAELLDDGDEPPPPAPDADPLAVLAGLAEGPRDVPADPALARLLPSASRDDDERSAEFRRYTEAGLRQRKSANLRTAVDSMAAATGRRRDRVRVDRVQAAAWLTALTDVRLVLAERLGVRTDADAEALEELADGPADSDPRAWSASVYGFLTWLQESLVQALVAGRLGQQPPGRP